MELARATLPLLTLGTASPLSTANTGSPCRTTRRISFGTLATAEAGGSQRCPAHLLVQDLEPESVPSPQSLLPHVQARRAIVLPCQDQMAVVAEKQIGRQRDAKDEGPRPALAVICQLQRRALPGSADSQYLSCQNNRGFNELLGDDAPLSKESNPSFGGRTSC
jgi:hypothetical protein